MFRGENAQSLAGLALVLGLCWLMSEDRRRFPWRLVLATVAVQALLILALFGVPALRAPLALAGRAVDALAGSTQAGAAFVFGFLAGAPNQPYPVADPAALFIFGFRVLPVILVVCALAALLWHWRILRWLTEAFGFVFRRAFGLRGAPALATAATMFMGQVEGPIFIRGYLASLSRSELFLLIAVGMSCVSGSTMVAYVAILQGVLPNAAAHILTASIVSAPAGVLLSRIVVPSDPAVEGGADQLPGAGKTYESSVDAVIKGTGDGLQIVLNVAATLIVFVAFTAMVDGLLAGLPPVGGAPVTLERGLGLLLAPLAWSLGVPWRDAPAAGGLLAIKLVLTEFSAFIHLGAMPAAELAHRTRVIMTYALCGFANIASVGINVAGYNVLVPERRAEVISLVWKAMATGFLATCFSAAIVGALPAAVVG